MENTEDRPTVPQATPSAKGRGGARPGAGRKPKDEKERLGREGRITVSLNQAQRAFVDHLCEEASVKDSEAVRSLVEQARLGEQAPPVDLVLKRLLEGLANSGVYLDPMVVGKLSKIATAPLAPKRRRPSRRR